MTLLREHDWIVRQRMLATLKLRRYHIYRQIIVRLGPDEVIDGEDIAQSLPFNGIVVPLKDKPRKTYKQTKITDHFVKQR